MPRQAPRIDRRLVRALRRLDDPSSPIAETSRRVGALAEQLGLARPSHEQVRLLARSRLLQDVYVGRRSPRALFE